MSAGESPRFAVRLRSSRVQKDLDGLPRTDYRRINAKLRALADDPHPAGCEKLYDNVYRVRVGDWRIIYMVDAGNERVDVGGIRRRNERTYRRVEDLFG